MCVVRLVRAINDDLLLGPITSVQARPTKDCAISIKEAEQSAFGEVASSTTVCDIWFSWISPAFRLRPCCMVGNLSGFLLPCSSRPFFKVALVFFTHTRTLMF